ncbi:MAG: hypothetical protein IJH84_06675 [Saccharopolyspora sp.]|uniref:hypothetical protein n=1 Tax=Saccharopolyspora TaxID=1835 RepID=UPI00190B7BF6|nr:MULTISPECIES: hypothetical protein [unclassified Saccharopolyspora]MBK0866978.1 hypothetical protein [Saccharopolyspora sp. HNM0986]MBQ6640702.1 hypothetical protein [Saccharopolyspora sp.]
MRRKITSLSDLDEAAGRNRPEAAESRAPQSTGGQEPSGGQQAPHAEFDFELPRGYLHTDGTVHRHGRMRLATARDELRPQIDLRVKENPAYLSVVLLSQVITRLGDLTSVHAGLVENMYATDIAFLQDFYRRINSEGHTRAGVTCPSCSASFEIDLAGGRLGES